MRKAKLLTCLLMVLTISNFLAAQIKFAGYFSFEYLKSQPEGAFPLGAFENLNGGLAVSGLVYGRLTFLTEATFIYGSNPVLAQAWLAFQGSKLFNFKFGLFEIPFGRFNQSSRPYENPTVLRPLVFHFFPYRWHDLGLAWEGNYTIFYYSAYLVNGLSADQDGYLQTAIGDINKDKAFGGRLGLRLGEGFELGGSVYTGKYDAEATKDVQFEGVDLIWVTPEWEVRGEYIRALYDHPFLSRKIDFDGYYLTVSMLFKRLRLYFSYQDSAVPQAVFDDQKLPPLNIFLESMVNKTRKALGFKWDVANNFFFKLEYDWNKEKQTNYRDNTLSIQLGFMF